MAAKHCQFEIYKSAGGEYRWRLRAKNGEKIAQGESHPTKRGAKAAIEAVRRCAADAIVEDLT